MQITEIPTWKKKKMLKDAAERRNPRPSEVAEILERAATLIEKHGWTSDWSQRTNDEALDMYEAVLTAAPVRHWTAIRALNRQAEREGYGYEFGVFDYNRDTNDKRKVVRFMRRTAASINKGALEPFTDEWGDQAWR